MIKSKVGHRSNGDLRPNEEHRSNVNVSLWQQFILTKKAEVHPATIACLRAIT